MQEAAGLPTHIQRLLSCSPKGRFCSRVNSLLVAPALGPEQICSVTKERDKGSWGGGGGGLYNRDAERQL